MSSNYPRDLIGHGRRPPHAGWPGGARLALQVVLNYEEGAENSILHDDEASESFLSEMGDTPAIEGARHHLGGVSRPEDLLGADQLDLHGT